MRCERSCFSLTLYRKLLCRYWPLWAVWLAGWFMAVAVPIWNEEGSPAVPAANVAQLLPSISALAAPMAILAAVLVFFYLFKSSSTDMLLALPFRREGLFLTSLLAGLSILILPLVVVALLTLASEAAMGVVALRPLLEWLGGAALVCFFWFSFATLCCVISGHALAAASFFAIFNFVVPVMASLVEALCTTFLFGFAGFGSGVQEAIGWCTPYMSLLQRAGDWWGTLWVYTGVGFLMLLAALGLHHIRRAERAGELVSFTPLRLAFKVSVILCGGLSLGLLFTMVFFGDFTGKAAVGWPLTLCCCVAAVLSALVAEMLLKKTFRVLKSWPWAAVSALVFAVLLAGLQFDVIGFADRVPASSSVERATLYATGDDLSTFDLMAYGELVFQGDDVAALTGLHSTILAHRDTSTGDFRRVILTYQLSSGFTLRRQYTLYTNGSRDPLEAALSSAIRTGRLSFSTDSLPYQVSVDKYWAQLDYSSSVLFREVETQQLWAAVVDDVENGRYQPQSTDDHSLSLTFDFANDAFFNSTRYSQTFFPGPTTTSTNRALALFPQLSQDILNPPVLDPASRGGGSELVP